MTKRKRQKKPQAMPATNRRQIRYLLRRLRSHEEDGLELPVLPEGFMETFERQERFRGWSNYQKVWDVDDIGWTIKFLNKSAEQAWNELLAETVPELPGELSGTESNIRPN